MMENGMSPADVMAMMGNRDNDGYAQNMWNNPFVYLIWIYAFRMFGNGWGGQGTAESGALTRAQLYDGFTMNNVERKLDGITNGLCDGFYAQNTNMLQGFNGIQRDLCTGFNSITSGISELGYKTQDCCCTTNRNIDAVRYENAQNTCAITNAIHSEGEATRALINANTVQELRDRLEARDRDLLTANFQLSQQAQSANLINRLAPCPIPAYLTCSPYETTRFNNGCGCNC